MLPTTFAPRGILRMKIIDATVRCRVAGAGHTPSATLTYSVAISRWSAGSYVSVGTITHTNTTDPLASVPLTTPLGDGHGTLGKYIESWSSATQSDVRTAAVDGKASASVPGIASLRTVPTRMLDGAPDPLSAVSLTLGSLSCTAEDHR